MEKNPLFFTLLAHTFFSINVFYNFQDNVYFHQALRFLVRCNSENLEGYQIKGVAEYVTEGNMSGYF